MREKNKEQHKKHHRFNMSFDNLAIPEVNTKSHDDTVAIPEIHIRKKKDK